MMMMMMIMMMMMMMMMMIMIMMIMIMIMIMMMMMMMMIMIMIMIMIIDQPIDNRYGHKMNEQSMDDDPESIAHLSIDKRTIDTRSKSFFGN